MTKVIQTPLFRYSALIFLGCVATLLLFPGLFGNLLSTSHFMPHRHCYFDNSRIIWMHVISDGLIGLSYVCISSTLAYLVFKASKHIPFHWVFLAFGLFIVSCGFTHFMEILTMWKPVYWLAGYIKVITAAASIATAIVLFPLVPRVFALISAVQMSEERKVKLEKAHVELEALYNKVKSLDELKSNFFANVSHELRTPLALILGPAQKWAGDRTISEQQRNDMQLIARQATILLKQVNDLLDTSKLDAGKMALNYAVLDLAQLVKLLCQNFEVLARERKIDFKVNLAGNVAGDFDPEKMQKIISNLLSNAFKFAPEGGKISCELKRQDKTVHFRIEDNGPGVPEHLRGQIFERFQQGDASATRRFGGTGLGLAIVKEFVQMQGGSVTVGTSALGGAAFDVLIPLHAPVGVSVQRGVSDDVGAILEEGRRSAETVRTVPKTEPATVVSQGQPRVLIVEDNVEMNRFIADSLSQKFQVVSAFDGRDGLRKAQESTPDLIITDMMMPEMSGEQLLGELRNRAEFGDIPVIVLTAKAEQELCVRLLRQGAQDFLAKPFSPEELLARVSNLTGVRKVQKTLQRDLETRTRDIAALAEEAVRRKNELKHALSAQREAEQALHKLNQSLENRIVERTAELEAANQELEMFTSSVAHDLRAPLRAIRGMTQVLADEYADKFDDVARDYSRKITDGTLRMDALISDLLSYSRISRGEFPLNKINLGFVLGEAEAAITNEIQQRGAKVSVERFMTPIQGNATLLIQALVNLISNGMKFVPAGKTPEVRVRVEDLGRHVRIWVEDNGIGIAEEHQARIFKMFERLHTSSEFPGTGIGLTIVQKAVRRMQGSLGVESELGKGSRFWIELAKV